MCVKSKFVLRQPRYNLLTEKRVRKSTHYFEDMLLLSVSRNFLQTPSSDDILAGNFTWSDSIILVESLVR